MARPKLLDLFCGAGGAAMGYYRAGFDVVGVDIKPMPRYPFEFHQADALEYCREHGAEFDAIHASPPCQGYSVTKSINGKTDYPLLIGDVREILIGTGIQFVIENVKGAPLMNPMMLCGTMFPGLKVYRHRFFEMSNPIYFAPMSCNHSFSMPKSKGEYHTLDSRDFITCAGHNFQASSGKIALGINWMTRDEMAQAIPPAYTEFIGAHLLKVI